MIKDALITKVTEGLYSNAKQNKAVSSYQEELKFFNWILKKNPDLSKFLNSPFVDYKDKIKSIEDLFSNVFVSEIILFIKLLIEKKLIADIKQIYDVYDSLAEKDNNIVVGTIYTPFKLTTSQLESIQTSYAKKLNKNVVLKEIIDKSLILGVKIILDGQLYEYSASNELNSIYNKITSTKEEK